MTDIIETLPPKKKPKNYLNNKDMKYQLELSFAQGRITEELGKMFIMLAAKVAKKGCYISYSYNDEMQSQAILSLCKGWHKFNMAYDNPFAYYTQCVKNAFTYILNNEKREMRRKNAIMVDMGLNPSNSFTNEDYDEARGNTLSHERNSDNDGVNHNSAFESAEDKCFNIDYSSLPTDIDDVDAIIDLVVIEK